MSEINHATVWYPPQFPLEGRLPSSDVQVYQNFQKQRQLAEDYHDGLCLAAGSRVLHPCTKTLHISLCFDGTGNNLNHDLYESETPHPTNIARMFRASIGEGHAGGTAHNGSKARGLTDVDGNGEYYKYYLPGVGTPFAELDDLDYSGDGLAFARGGEKRINWALLMIIDALRRALKQPRLDDRALRTAVDAMGTLAGTEWAMGHSNRAIEMRKQLWDLQKPLSIALNQPFPGHPKLLGIRLYVYGFSRGAAAARAFVNWLNRLLSPTEATPCLVLGDLKLPISVEYLGLLDTVVSVGIADLAPGANGHMGWGDGSQELPSGNLLKRCLHIVASHEQRLSFPSESIRRESGEYPANSVEVIYPGVHSDQGGGYPPGDQGKAYSQDPRVGDGLLMSQIALHDLYSDAFAHGAPLKVSKDILPVDLRYELWRAMEVDLEKAFAISPSLINRFNAWRQVTLGLPPAAEPLPREQSERYQPLPANVRLEQAMRNQMDWLTAWRIERYGFASLKNTSFYLQASDTHADPKARQLAEAEHHKKQAAIQKRRDLQRALQRAYQPEYPLEPSLPDFEPDIAQTQLREAAEEFAGIYRDLDSDPYLTLLRRVRWLYVPAMIAYQASADTRAERQRMKAAAQPKVTLLFPPPPRERNHTDQTNRGNVDESRNASAPEGLLRALFDDQVHDSRAWFLHTALNGTYWQVSVAAGREPWGSYFCERMVFFGKADRRTLALFSDSQASTLMAGMALPDTDPAYAVQPRVMDARYFAESQQAIAAHWEAYYAQMNEVSDV